MNPFFSPLVSQLANIVSLSRVLSVFLFTSLPSEATYTPTRILALALAFGLDVVDGYIARRLRLVSIPGAFIDIFMDRIMEMTLWLYFALHIDSLGLFPLTLLLRICVVDYCRLYLAIQGQEQADGVWLTGWRRTLVASKLSKGTYNALKLLVFLLLLWHSDLGDHGAQDRSWVWVAVLLWPLTVLSLVRGAPIVMQTIQYGREARRARNHNRGSRPADPYTNLFVLQLLADAVFITLLSASLAMLGHM